MTSPNSKRRAGFEYRPLDRRLYPFQSCAFDTSGKDEAALFSRQSESALAGI